METFNQSIFFTVWKEVYNSQKEKLLKNFSDKSTYTRLIKDGPDSIVKEIGKRLEMNDINEYYSIDTVYYRSEDKYNTPGTWLKRIRIAFEHENDCTYSYQEVCHLCLTNCDQRVLVTYGYEDPVNLLKTYQNIIESQSDPKMIKILIIFGWFKDHDIDWKGYSYVDSKWVSIE